MAAGGGQQASTAEILARAQQRQQAEVEAQTPQALLQAGSEALRAEGEKPLTLLHQFLKKVICPFSLPKPKYEAPPSSAVPPTQSEPVQSELAQPEPSLSDNEFEQAVARTERNSPSAPPTRGTLNISKQEAQSETSRVPNRAYGAFGRRACRRLSRIRSRPSPSAIESERNFGCSRSGCQHHNIAKGNGASRAALELNPKDTLARAALAGLAANSDPSTNESELETIFIAARNAALIFITSSEICTPSKNKLARSTGCVF